MMDAKRPTPRHIIMKKLKVIDKERTLKSSNEKKVSYQMVARWKRGRGRMHEEVSRLRSTNR